MLNTVVKFVLAMGKTPAVKKFGKELVTKAMNFIKQNPKKVEKMKTTVKQDKPEDLPIFKKLGNKYVSEGYDFSGLNKGTDISKGMLKK